MKSTIKLSFLCLLVPATLACASDPAEVATEWKRLATDTIERTPTDPATRPALLSKVAAAVERARRVAQRRSGPESGADRIAAAIAVAAFVALEHIAPDQREELESRLAVTFSRIPENDAKAEGAAIGRRATLEILAER